MCEGVTDRLDGGRNPKPWTKRDLKTELNAIRYLKTELNAIRDIGSRSLKAEMSDSV
jgi:hypothetical protein